MIIVYDPINGPSCPDGRIESGWKFQRWHKVWRTGSMLMIDRARVAQVEGEIDELVIRHNGQDYPVVDGMFNNTFWADVTDYHVDYLSRILG